MKTKIFAAYLPQYHEIPENNEFWGEGFTDWVGVRQAKPQFEGHKQPRVPKDNNYYDLSNPKVIKWQANLAKEHGVDGFNIYHYWFKDGHKVLEKPAEILLNHPEIDIEFFFSWDNTSWVRSWSNIAGNNWAPTFDRGLKQDNSVLLQLDYGNEIEWKEHFNYLLPFFNDKRYYKIQGRPVFALMKTSDDGILLSMRSCWDGLAKESGFPGIIMMTGTRVACNYNLLDSQFVYQPRVSAWGRRETLERLVRKYIKIQFPRSKKGVRYYYDYEKVWKRILSDTKRKIDEKVYFGGFVRYDDTPRRGKQAEIIGNDSPELFEKYFGRLYRLNCDHNKEFLLLTAWNEWGEGAYLEPDTENGYAYLEALKRAIESCSE